MFFRTDPNNRFVADHGLGDHYAGVPGVPALGVIQIGPGGGSLPGGIMSRGEARAGADAARIAAGYPPSWAYPNAYAAYPPVASPCPPPGYPSHTEWNGVSCCSCVPAQPLAGLGQALRSANVRCEIPATGATAGYAPCTYATIEQADQCCHAVVGPHTQACRRSTG